LTVALPHGLAITAGLSMARLRLDYGHISTWTWR